MNNIFSNTFKDRLITSLTRCENIRIFSPYLTESAVNFIIGHLKNLSRVDVIIRVRPQDIASGSVEVSAIKKIIDNSGHCYIHRTLHGKFYQVDYKEGYIGSANLTSNGLCISGYGNLELTTHVHLTDKDQDLLQSVVDDSILVDKKILDHLQDFETSCDNKNSIAEWWDEIKLASYNPQDGIYIGDLPWCDFNIENESLLEIHDEDVFRFGGTYEEMRVAFLNSKIYQNVLYALKQKENEELYFGELSQHIHNSLRDNPLPYRREIKTYVRNILSYFSYLTSDIVMIDRPSYSQRIKLLKNTTIN